MTWTVSLIEYYFYTTAHLCTQMNQLIIIFKHRIAHSFFGPVTQYVSIVLLMVTISTRRCLNIVVNRGGLDMFQMSYLQPLRSCHMTLNQAFGRKEQMADGSSEFYCCHMNVNEEKIKKARSLRRLL